jgi:lipopolysaccharide transport system permease protein
MMDKNAEWDIVVKGEASAFRLDLKELWKYRDLIYMFVKRDFIAIYKQTILGPAWHFVQPILSTITFTFIFGRIAGLSTDGIPAPVFYMSGIILWGYFSECFKKTSGTFIANAHIFGKVYFPRMVMPISVVISALISLSVQMILLLGVWMYYYFQPGSPLNASVYIFLFPLLILIMAIMGLGFGIVVSSLTTKYRDFTHLVGFGIQLLMYLSPVIYPLSTVSGDFRYILLANPMTPIIETFRFAFLGSGEFSWFYLLYSGIFSITIFVFGIFLFNRVEKTFTDTL